MLGFGDDLIGYRSDAVKKGVRAARWEGKITSALHNNSTRPRQEVLYSKQGLTKIYGKTPAIV